MATETEEKKEEERPSVSILKMLLEHEANLHPSVRAYQMMKARHGYPAKPHSEKYKPFRRTEKRRRVLMNNSKAPVSLTDVR